MAQDTPARFRLTVLNPGGRDSAQHFANGSSDSAPAHPPTNFHAYAACTGGSFYREVKGALAEATPALLLLRGDFIASERALNALQAAKLSVAISLKETGLHQIADQLRDPRKLNRLVRIVRQADGCLAPTQEAADLYRAIRGAGERVAFIPTPYPVEDEHWNFSRPVERRRGIFIGTREWDVPSRNHLATLLIARRISEETRHDVTVFNFDGRKGVRLLSEIGFAPKTLRVLETQLEYRDYLREIARHKIVLQLDTSFVPGQVAGDALLCRVPCVGGNGAIDRLVFPESCSVGRSMEEVVKLAGRLLTDQAFYGESVSKMEQRATKQLSFRVGADRLEQFFHALPGPGQPDGKPIASK
jgi:hypothetical protein